MDTSARNWTIGIVIAVLLFSLVGINNGIVGKANEARNQWANVQSSYQRRTDLVKQSMPAVIGGSNQELAVFKELTNQAAALAGSFRRDEFGQPIVPQGADAEKVQGQIAAFDKAFINAMSYMADNPDITSTQLYADFMVQVEGSENRINIARRDYNAAVTNYRNSVQMFPGSFVAGFGGHTANQFPYFQAQEGADQAPSVDFPTPAQ
jgi:LemA protein